MVETKTLKLYTGISTDYERRLHEHNFTRRGSKALRGQRPVVLVFVSPLFYTKSYATKLEYQIKRLSPFEKRKLVSLKTDTEKIIALHLIGKKLIVVSEENADLYYENYFKDSEFVRKSGFVEIKDVKVIKESEKARKVLIKGTEYWLPKSATTYDESTSIFSVQIWLAELESLL